jgi:hypothetical protein
LEEFFKSRLPNELSGGTINAQVSLMGSADIAKPINGNVLGIYLHRITIDQHGRTRFSPPRGTELRPPTAELPVNLHFLLIASASSATIEADLIAWAMVELANHARLDIGWGEREMINIVPEEMETEELMRLFDLFDKHYTSTMAYVARTVRLRLNQPRTEGPAVVTRVLPGGMQ